MIFVLFLLPLLDGKDNAWRRKYILLKRHLLQAFSTCLDDQIDAIIHERVEEKMEREIEEGDGDFELVFVFCFLFFYFVSVFRFFFFFSVSFSYFCF